MGFDSRPVHVGFVVHKVALGQCPRRVLRFPLSVTFHQCSTVIRSPVTNGVVVFGNGGTHFVRLLPNRTIFSYAERDILPGFRR